MNQEIIARVIVAVGYTLAKKYPPNQVQMTGGGVDEQSYSYSGSYSEKEFKLRENPGGEYIEVRLVEGSSGYVISYSNREVATIEVSGSSGNAQDTYNSRSYHSINFTSSSVRMDGISFQVG
jgi:hypothetical protein